MKRPSGTGVSMSVTCGLLRDEAIATSARVPGIEPGAGGSVPWIVSMACPFRLQDLSPRPAITIRWVTGTRPSGPRGPTCSIGRRGAGFRRPGRAGDCARPRLKSSMPAPASPCLCRVSRRPERSSSAQNGRGIPWTTHQRRRTRIATLAADRTDDGFTVLASRRSSSRLNEPAAPRTAVGPGRPVSTPHHPRICPAGPCPKGFRC